MSDSVWPHRWQPTRLPHPWDSLGKNTGVGCHFLLQCTKVKSESEVAQSCPSLCDPMDCSPPGSSIHGIFQAKVLEWGAIAFSNNGILLNHKKEWNTWTSLAAPWIGITYWGCGFDPWSGKIPHAVEHVSPCATTTEPMCCKYWSPHT